MYCKICGTKNDPSSTYCKNDGHLLINNSLNVVKKSNESKFCTNCGSNKSPKDLYCFNCGISFFDDEKINKKNKGTNIDINAFKDIGDKLDSINALNFKESLNLSAGIYGFIGFLIVLIFSGIFTNIVNSEVSKMIFDNFAGSNPAERLNFLNVLDTLLVMNVPKLRFTADILSKSESINLLVKGGVLSLLFIPLFSFIVLGFIKGNDDLKNNSKLDFITFLTNGLVYAILIFVISIIRRGKTIIPIGFFDLSINLTREYGLINAMVNSFILYGLGTMIGYGISTFFNKENNLDDMTLEIMEGFRAFFIISMTVIFLTVVFIVLKEKNKALLNAFVRIEIGGIFLSLANIGSCTTGYLDDKEVINMFTKDLSEIGLGENYFILFLLFVILIFGVFFLIGRKNKLKGNNKFYIASIVYSISIFLFSSMQNIKYVVSETYLTSLKDAYDIQGAIIGDIRLLLGALILSLAASFVGYLITNEVYEDE